MIAKYIWISTPPGLVVTDPALIAELGSFRPSYCRGLNCLLHRYFGQPAAPRALACVPRSPPLFPKHRNPPRTSPLFRECSLGSVWGQRSTS